MSIIEKENHVLSSNLVISFNVNKKNLSVPRFYLCSNKEDFDKMISYVVNIDMVIHPSFGAFPAIFELTDNKGPTLTEVSEVYFKSCVKNHEDTLIAYKNQYNEKFSNL